MSIGSKKFNEGVGLDIGAGAGLGSDGGCAPGVGILNPRVLGGIFQKFEFAVLVRVVDNKGFWFHKDTR